MKGRIHTVAHVMTETVVLSGCGGKEASAASDIQSSGQSAPSGTAMVSFPEVPLWCSVIAPGWVASESDPLTLP